MSARYLNVADLREAAKKKLPRGLFEFVDRGVEDEVALYENRRAFERIKMRPSVMTDVSQRRTTSQLFGREVAMPLVIAPTGAAGLCWFEGELALARAASKLGVPFTLATSSMTDMARISRALDGGRFWFQLYMYAEKSLSFELVRRAREHGCEALLLTVDQTAVPNREYMQKNAFSVPFAVTPRSALDILFHPGWFFRVLLRYLLTTGMPRNLNYPTGFQGSILSDPKKRVGMANDTISWDDLRKLRETWSGKLLVKGILRPEDAEQCARMGVDGVIVSNHGGRTFDCAPSPIDVLPQIVAAVRDRCAVLLDSGIRRGSDIAKAVALGAQAVLVGRATLYGIAAAGEAGAARALSLLQRELLDTMAFLGCNEVAGITRDAIRPGADWPDCDA